MTPLDRIIAEVAMATGVKRSEIMGGSRVRHIVSARHLAMWRARNETDMSLPAIGRVFRRDHTSILHAIRRMDGIMEGKANDA